MMEKSTKKAIMMVDHNTERPSDPFKCLPENILLIILSLLSIDEAARTSILSKRWRSKWKHMIHLDFDVKHMIYPLARLTTSPGTHLDFILNLDKEKRVHKYNMICFRILKERLGNLISCRFTHLPFNDVTACLSVLLEQEKGLKYLTIECEPIHTMSKPKFVITFNGSKYRPSLESFELVRYSLNHTLFFEVVFKKLKTLKLKEIQMGDKIINEILRSCLSLKNFTVVQSSGFTIVNIKSSSLTFLELSCMCVNHIEISTSILEVLVLGSISCPANELVLNAPNLSEFHFHSNQEISTHVRKTHDLLEHWTGLLGRPRSERIFRNLTSLLIDLDLNNLREALSLSYVLRTSPCLQTLKIVIPVDKCSEDNIHAGVSKHLRSTFWEGRAICHCVYRKLIMVHIEGFTGKDLEVDFIKYLIASSTRMKRITIVCHGSLDEANELRSIDKASSKLFIEIMAAKRAQ